MAQHSKSGGGQNAAQKDAERAALFASGAVVVGFILYWSIQVQAVREMLELAYG